jgi:2-dehydro-3-deoxyphosphogalactonate aldolase
MLSYPGVMTPTECFAALGAGADGIKLFPASLIGPAGLAAIRAVLPAGTRTYAVGGVGPGNFADWHRAGVTGFGIGSGIYVPGASAAEVGTLAREIAAAYDRVFAAPGGAG